MKWLGWIWDGITWLVGLVAGSKESQERAAGEKLGQAETERDNAVGGISEIQHALDAQPVADGGGVRDGKDPAAAPYRPGPD